MCKDCTVQTRYMSATNTREVLNESMIANDLGLFANLPHGGRSKRYIFITLRPQPRGRRLSKNGFYLAGTKENRHGHAEMQYTVRVRT